MKPVDAGEKKKKERKKEDARKKRKRSGLCTCRDAVVQGRFGLEETQGGEKAINRILALSGVSPASKS